MNSNNQHELLHSSSIPPMLDDTEELGGTSEPIITSENGTGDADKASHAPKRPEDTTPSGDAKNGTGEDNHHGTQDRAKRNPDNESNS